MEEKEAFNPAMLQEYSLVCNNANVGDRCRGGQRGGGGYKVERIENNS